MTDARRMCYRELRRYKYQVTREYTLATSIVPDAPVDTSHIALTAEGTLTIRKSYAWDGPSGPTVDTPSFMRGSLVHDALYQLMRGRHLDAGRHRKAADALLKQLCLEDGMWAFRAAYVYRSLRLFGKANALPRQGPEPQDVIICVP